ncbi:alpha/beta fold hydrolase [Methyloglobulus sp.]|uniref:alpha/beta fold hydrolase n=1 Tax=Methyloglobulus sp. TaxID=2518622 RepID=UPI003988EC92
METVDLAYEELGSHNPVPLIILHGFFASSRNWRRIAETLSAAFHVYALDLRNHGLSPHHPLMDYPIMTADVLRFMDAHRLVAAHIMGHRMGGKVAMWLALNHPDRTDKLLVVDIAPKSYTHNFDKTIQALIDLPLDKIHNRKQAEIMLSTDIPDLDYRQFLLQNLTLKEGRYHWRIDVGIFMQMASNIVAFPETHNLAPHQGETLFIAGADSSYVAPEDTLRLFPNALLKTIALLRPGIGYTSNSRMFLQQWLKVSYKEGHN